MARRGYTWEPRTQRYRNAATGRFLSHAEVRRALDMTLRSQRLEMRRLTQEMQAGRISVGEWRLAMQVRVKDTHLMSAALAKGGWAKMTPTDYGRVGAEVRFQYRRLERFAVQLAGNEIPMDGRVIRRAELYFESGRSTYHETQRAVMEAGGMNEERSVLNPADHCDECIQEARKGWVPIRTLIPIGRRQCLGNCKCSMRFRAARFRAA